MILKLKTQSKKYNNNNHRKCNIVYNTGILNRLNDKETNKITNNISSNYNTPNTSIIPVRIPFSSLPETSQQSLRQWPPYLH